MKLKHLESCLSSLPNRKFPNPKIELEQYPTSVHLTSSIIISALAKGDAGPGISVLDLGCGTGILGLGFALVQSDIVYLLDCDPDALKLARENVDMLVEEEMIGRRSDNEEGCRGVELIMAKLKHGPQRRSSKGNSGRGNRGGNNKKGKSQGMKYGSSTSQDNAILEIDLTGAVDDGIPLSSKIVDTVITNPPFGTKNNEGIDLQFLRTAIRLARRSVYSFHKTSTRPYLMKLLREKWGLNAEVVAEMKFDIPNMYKFHKQKCVDVNVDLLRIFWDEKDSSIEGVDIVIHERKEEADDDDDEEEDESER